MKFDKELARQILLAVEASEGTPHQLIKLDIKGYGGDLVSYHVHLLDEAGFLEAKDLSHMTGYVWRPQRLTFAGHEFLDSVRDPEVWRRTKDGAEKAGGSALGFLWELAKAYGKQVASERLGVDLG